MNLCTRASRDRSCLTDRQDIVQSTSRVFAKSFRDLALEKCYRGVSSASRRDCRILDSLHCDTLDLLNPLLVNEEVNRKSAVASGLPRNVRIQPYKPWRIGGLEPLTQQFLKKNSRSVSGASTHLGIRVIDTDMEFSNVRSLLGEQGYFRSPHIRI